MKVLPDPHHPEIKWKFENGKFYQNVCNSKKWQVVNRLHLTKDRVLMLNKLIME